MNTHKEFYGTWKEWLDLNVSNGCNKEELFDILLKNNFDYNLIKNELKIDYVPKKKEKILDKDINNFYDIKIKNGKKFNTDLIQLYTIDNFLTKDECDIIIHFSKNYLKKSEITNKNEKDKKFRTSYTCHQQNLDTIGKNYLKYINKKICDTISIPNEYSEEIQIQFYDVGQEFKLHSDYFNIDSYQEYCIDNGNRTWTFMVYLNDVEKGGATYISKINQRFFPKTGKALIWNNLLEDGSNNINTLHAGEPVIKGTKIIITKWFRQKAK